jgi:hypothetical protein
MPAAENVATLRSAIKSQVRNLGEFITSSAGSEVAAILVMMVLVGLVTCPLALFADAPVTADGKAPVNPCAAQIAANSTAQTSNQVQVSSTSGVNNTIDVYTGRDGDTVMRVSAPLSVQNGKLPPNLCLGTVVSDLVRADGEAIPADQVTSWARTGNAGLRVFIYVEISARYGSATPSGGYTGTVSMDDARATGGNVPVTVHVEYPNLWRATMVCVVAAWVGFFWAWLVHLTRVDTHTIGRFWLYIILQVAVIVIVAFPVLNVQILSNPDWAGDVSQYIALATLAGGGALASTPTLRALVDRAAVFMLDGPDASDTPGSPAAPDSSTTTADQAVPAVPAGQLAGTPAGGDGSALTAPPGADASDGTALATPQGGDGSSLTAPQGVDGSDGGDGGAPATPPGGDGSSLPTPQGSDGGDGAAPDTPQGGNGGDSGDGSSLSTPQGGDGSSLSTPQGANGGDAGTLTAPPVPPAPSEQ